MLTYKAQSHEEEIGHRFHRFFYHKEIRLRQDFGGQAPTRSFFNRRFTRIFKTEQKSTGAQEHRHKGTNQHIKNFKNKYLTASREQV
jgi:hypothetical protein